MTEELKIQELINNYATFADSKQTQKQFALFAKGAGMSVFYPWNAPDQPDEVDNPEKLLATFEALKQYERTFHFIGQQTIHLAEDGETATAYVYTIAHHVIPNEDGTKSLMIAYLRYEDDFKKEKGDWKFAHRNLYADFIENRPLT